MCFIWNTLFYNILFLWNILCHRQKKTEKIVTYSSLKTIFSMKFCYGEQIGESLLFCHFIKYVSANSHNRQILQPSLVLYTRKNELNVNIILLSNISELRENISGRMQDREQIKSKYHRYKEVYDSIYNFGYWCFLY